MSTNTASAKADAAPRIVLGVAVQPVQERLPGLDGVLVHLHRILTVFFLVAFFDGLGGELTGLADGHKTGSQAGGEDRSHDEAARLNAHDLRDAFVFVHLVHRVRKFLQGGWVFE